MAAYVVADDADANDDDDADNDDDKGSVIFERVLQCDLSSLGRNRRSTGRGGG